ncbi:dolichyldiphosphatase 1 [Plasmopara halstedii]|uniref:Dolichyldiphosphatase n=1 Tax=Plasmopara halstedii TaxID=4781 RepID=A0A0P1AYE8_PLAHL|nr:dolichyldiphosphatase 1 [Plasmopara halstedii]CEG46156.1 dolichyldiphosphatase 1 [Plasmopara halstedii]|eukprot:XP_024582525.1 dolichyldiphosphatase 1 [Plasmopara halstedii]
MELARTVQEFELTWVVYDPKDPFGAMLALCTLSPIFLIVVYLTVVVSQRDLDSISMLIGQLVSIAINKVLKKLINQPRPEGAYMSGSGMPSAHSQFMGFFAAYFVIYTSKRLNSRRRLEQGLTIVCAIMVAMLTCYSRIHLNYHSTDQVVVGVAFGILTGILWYTLVASTSSWLFPLVAESRIAKFLFVRDISHIPDLTVFQHEIAFKAASTFPSQKLQ